LGRFLPFEVYRVVQYIPGLDLFRVPARHLMEVDLALAILAGRGLSAITSIATARSRRLTCVGTAGVVVTIGIVAARIWASPGTENFLSALRIPEFWCPIIAATAAAVVLWLGARGFRHTSAVAMAVLIVDLSLWGQFSGWRSSPRPDNEIFGEAPAITFLKQQQAALPPFRVLSVFPPADSFYTPLQQDNYMLHGLENAAGYDAFALQRYSNFTGGMKEWGELIDPSRSLADDKVFDLLNVRYLIAKRTADGRIHSGTNAIDENSLSDHWRISALFNDVAIYANTRSQPRAWLAAQTAVIPDDADMLRTIRTGKLPDGRPWDITRTVLLAGGANLAQAEDVPATVEIINYGPDRISMKTDSATPAVLVLAENYYPGWQATVDGDEKNILQVNYYQRGVELAAGGHVVEFYYRPWPFRLGTIISVMTLFGLGQWWSIGRDSRANGDDG
jgi:hypothetical protein